jgi:site-specific recombinase XerD
MRQTFPPPRNPMAPLFRRAAESLTTSLTAESAHFYQCTGRHFLNYLDARYPRVRSLGQLRRDPHILDWLTLLRSHQPPLAKVTYAHYVIRLRRILEELAWTQGVPLLTRLVRSDDIPSPDRCLPRPLTAEQDRLIQQELLRRDDRDSNALLLLRHTGMRMGECLDLPLDCLRRIGQDQWGVHVPLGKLRTERFVPVDSFVCRLVDRLRSLRSQGPRDADGFLLARPRGRMALGAELRRSLHQVAAAAGITARIVPHQFRHSFATEMLRAGVSLPVLMKLLGHQSPNMTMRYVEVSLLDVEHEFQLARLQPRHLLPAPKITPATAATPDLSSLLNCLRVAQHVLEMFRRTLPPGPHRRLLDRLANRLTKIVAEARKLDQS